MRNVSSKMPRYDVFDSYQLSHVVDLTLFFCFPSLAEDTTLESFFAGTKGKFKHPMVTAWVNELDAERAESRAIKK